MDNSAEIMKLIEAGLQQDSVKVLNYSMLLITKLESKGDLNAAERLRKIIKNSKTLALKAKDCSQIINSPVDSESRLPLAEIKQYSLDSIFLSVSDIAKESIEEYISIIDNAGELSEKGIKINRNLLLYGPPGVGKTQAAKYISARTQLPLVTVRIDGLVSSYLGSTS
ncbi:MAG: AAA family ATPase, partial [Deltaproteobacteria bacterium]|nr:AAA family ATPase [Deltaproteobacteria bacterium]